MSYINRVRTCLTWIGSMMTVENQDQCNTEHRSILIEEWRQRIMLQKSAHLVDWRFPHRAHPRCQYTAIDLTNRIFRASTIRPPKWKTPLKAYTLVRSVLPWRWWWVAGCTRDWDTWYLVAYFIQLQTPGISQTCIACHHSRLWYQYAHQHTLESYDLYCCYFDQIGIYTL